MKKRTAFLLILIITAGFLATIYCFAQEENPSDYGTGYYLLEPLPGVQGQRDIYVVSSLSQYLQWLFAFTISFAAIMAVLFIVIGGIQYLIAYGDTGKVSSAKTLINNALLGLLLIICSWLILNTINPDFTNTVLNIPAIITTQNTQVPTTTQAPTRQYTSRCVSAENGCLLHSEYGVNPSYCSGGCGAYQICCARLISTGITE